MIFCGVCVIKGEFVSGCGGFVNFLNLFVLKKFLVGVLLLFLLGVGLYFVGIFGFLYLLGRGMNGGKFVVY